MKPILRDYKYFIKNSYNILKLKLAFKNADIRDPLQVAYSKLSNIHIANEVFIDIKSIIRILDECELYIGEGTYMGPFCHLSGTINKIKIGKNVLMAPRVYITTTNYDYQDINIPIINQGYTSKGDVVVEDGAWIGIGACLLSGTRVGKNSVIGSNSVVTRDIPPHSIAVGSPARVVKQFDEKEKKWVNKNR